MSAQSEICNNPGIKKKIIDEFGDQLPETMDYQIGYFHGKQSAKRWIMTQEDLNLMYESKLSTSVCSDSEKSVVLSPGKVTELRSKKLQELRELQCLNQHLWMVYGHFCCIHCTLIIISLSGYDLHFLSCKFLEQKESANS